MPDGSLGAAPGRREQRKIERREAIVAVARRSFLGDGYAATSMSGLLDTLGGSKATLWRHFHSKESLFEAVVVDVTDSYRRQVEAELSITGELEPTLIAFCRSFMEVMTSPDALATWRLVVAESMRFPETGRIFYERAARHVHSTLRRFIDHHIREGRLRDEGAEKMALMLINLCTGLQSRMLWGLSAPSPELIASDARDFTRYFLSAFES